MEAFQQAEACWERDHRRARTTRTELQAARARYRVSARSSTPAPSRPIWRARAPPSSSSWARPRSLSCSDRVEFVDALTQTDADLANDVENLRNELAAQEASQQRLQAKAAKALAQVEAKQAVLDAKMAEQQKVLDQLNADRARAEELVKDLKKQYRDELAALSGVRYDGNEVF